LAKFIEGDGTNRSGEGILLAMSFIWELMNVTPASFEKWNRARIWTLIDQVSLQEKAPLLRSLSATVGRFLRRLLDRDISPNDCIQQLGKRRRERVVALDG
jgi:hypothetical protein